MPNWCTNDILITGEETEIKKIETILENLGDTGVFEGLIGLNDDHTKENWYESNINYWGTKWDVSYDDCNAIISSNEIRLSPSTAWTPPINFCVFLSKKYDVKIVVKYYEGGNNFAGIAQIENGRLNDTQYDYLEGLYILDNEGFWIEMESQIQDAIDEEISFENFIESYNFITENDKHIIDKMFKEL